MQRPVCYDITRLLTRLLNATPNGIDRIDYALAQHFLGGDPNSTFGSTATGVGGRLMRGPAAAEAVAGIGAHWGETGLGADEDPVYQRAVAWVSGTQPALRAGPKRRKRRLANVPGIAGWITRHGLPATQTPRKHLPAGSLYVNSSQFPLWVASSFEWLEARRDVKAAFFIHDLLPVLMPEYFRAAEFERHKSRLHNFARFASAAIVTTKTVASDLEAHLATLGRRNVPIFIAPTPISPIFATPHFDEPKLRAHSYFVLCSTLEPRKNHLMILAVWRALVQRLGTSTPKLVLVGTRGWHYGPIIDLIERSPALHDHVLETNGLSTPGLKRLIDNCRAVLMPTFGEGYGLPVHEGLVAGAPVIASDVAAFREIESAALQRVSPLDGEAWLEAIAAASKVARREPASRLSTEGWAAYFGALDAFLEAL